MMKIRKILRKCFLWAVAVLGICLLSGCFPGFNSRDEVMAYLKKKYPGRQIVLSQKYKTRRGLMEDWRIWSFTLSGNPKDTFQVASFIKSYPVPMLKTERSIFDNFEKVVVLRRSREFEQGPLRTLDAPTRRLWHSFSSSEFWLKPLYIDLETVDDVWRAKHLIGLFEQFLSEEIVESDTRYFLRMYIQGSCYALTPTSDSINFVSGLTIAKPGEKRPYYIQFQIYNQINRQVVCQQFYNEVMSYYQLMAAQGNGVNAINMQAWAEDYLQQVARLPSATPRERDTLETSLGIKDKGDGFLFIDTGQKPYMFVFSSERKEGSEKTIFFTYPQLRSFCQQSGLQVKGAGNHFSVTSIDGHRYEFSTTFYIKGKDEFDFDVYTCYYLRDGQKVVMEDIWSPQECIDDALIRRITGRDVKSMVVHTADKQ